MIRAPACRRDDVCAQFPTSLAIDAAKTKAPFRFTEWGFARRKSLTMSYFHTGIRTIIGAEAFHCPVRDGKEWDHLAMVIRHNFLPSCLAGKTANS